MPFEGTGRSAPYKHPSATEGRPPPPGLASRGGFDPRQDAGPERLGQHRLIVSKSLQLTLHCLEKFTLTDRSPPLGRRGFRDSQRHGPRTRHVYKPLGRCREVRGSEDARREFRERAGIRYGDCMTGPGTPRRSKTHVNLPMGCVLGIEIQRGGWRGPAPAPSIRCIKALKRRKFSIRVGKDLTADIDGQYLRSSTHPGDVSRARDGTASGPTWFPSARNADHPLERHSSDFRS